MDLKCDRNKSLQGQIDQLVDKGLLSRAEAAMLHLLRYLGNTTVHEGTEPDDE